MLVITQFAKTPSVARLTKFWAERYTLDLSSDCLQDPAWSYRELAQAASLEGRANTAAKLEPSLVDIKCQMAGILARQLYEYTPNTLDLNEARRLTQSAYQIYLKLIEVYQLSSGITTSSWAMAGDSSLCAWGIPDIEQLAKILEPVLLEFQEQHIASKDWRTLGFITTLLNFSNKLLLYNLTPIEQALIIPYFKFVEEQVAIPWQRVCAAAAKHEQGSPALTLVEQLLPDCDRIAQSVYSRMTQLFPNHRSRRGGLTDPGIKHSCIRDLNMFQAYLWLCVLEGSMESVEKELVALCIMVMEGVGVSWELTEQWTELLIYEIMSRVTLEQRSLLQPYSQGMQQAFFKKRSRWGAAV